MFTARVIGKPQPAGSKRAFINRKTGKPIVTDDNPRAKPWQQEIASTVMGERFEGPVRLELTFYVRRPKGHFGTGSNSDRLKSSAPRFPTTKPDATKLVRAVEDALTHAGLWRDDSQVVEQHVRKVYATTFEGVEIVVCAFEPATLGACHSRTVSTSEQLSPTAA